MNAYFSLFSLYVLVIRIFEVWSLFSAKLHFVSDFGFAAYALKTVRASNLHCLESESMNGKRFLE